MNRLIAVDATAPSNRTARKMKEFLDNSQPNLAIDSVSVTNEANGQVNFSIQSGALFADAKKQLEAPMQDLANKLGAEVSMSDNKGTLNVTFTGDKLSIRTMETKLGIELAKASGTGASVA